MKTKLAIICVAIATLLCLFACSSAAPNQVSVDESYSGGDVDIAIEGLLTVTLESNATTGFQWELAGTTDPSVLEKLSNEYEAPEAVSPPGTGGKEVWIFKAIKKGKSTISMEYSRPWEGGEKAAQTFTLTVVVK